MITLESTVWIVVRICLGIFLSVVLSAVTWVLSRLFLQYLALDETTIYIMQSLLIGIPAGIGAVAAWWNPDSPLLFRLMGAFVIPPATSLCAWLTIEIRGVYIYYGLLGGSHRVPVIDIGDLLSTVIVSSIIAANCPGRSVLPLPPILPPRDLIPLRPLSPVEGSGQGMPSIDFSFYV